MRKILIYLLLFLLVFVAVIFIVPRLILIQTVNCKSQYGPCSNFLQSKIESIERGNLFKTKKILEDLLTKEAIIVKYSIRYAFPKTLEIGVIERKPIVVIMTQDSSNYFLVDREGKIFGTVSETILPRLNIKSTTGSLELGKDLSKETTFSCLLLRELSNIYGVKVAALERDSFTVSLPDGPIVIFPTQGDISYLLGSLTIVLSGLNSDQRDSRIDLRYKNPVIRDL